MSYALDTNGQNARFVEAARKYGKDKHVLRSFAIGNSDPAGVVGRFQLAAEKTEWLRIRSAHRSEAYFEFPRDILWDRSTDAEIRALAEEADVIHLNNSFRAMRYLRAKKKPSVIHHHGSLFRSQTAKLLAQAAAFGSVQAVSTIDLMRYAPDAITWLPSAYDVAALKAFGEAHRRKPDGRIRVVSAPTNRTWKSTDALEAAVAKLQAEGVKVDLVLIEGKTWDECMTVKATADIYFDQVILGYGCNAIEAWGMGIPVIAGADAWTMERMEAEYDGTIPFYTATVESIGDAIRSLAESKDMRAEYAGLGMAHVLRYHDEKPALAKLAELYIKAIIQRPKVHNTVVIRAPGQSWSQLMEQKRAARQAARLTIGSA